MNAFKTGISSIVVTKFPVFIMENLNLTRIPYLTNYTKSVRNILEIIKNK